MKKISKKQKKKIEILLILLVASGISSSLFLCSQKFMNQKSLSTYISGSYLSDPYYGIGEEDQEEIMDKVTKYCTGKNYNETKCRRYCNKMEYKHKLCEGRIENMEKLKDPAKSKSKQERCENYCSRSSKGFSERRCNEECGGFFEEYNQIINKTGAVTALSNPQSIEKPQEEKKAEQEKQQREADQEKINQENEKTQKILQSSSDYLEKWKSEKNQEAGFWKDIFGQPKINIGYLRGQETVIEVKISQLERTREEIQDDRQKEEISNLISQLNSSREELNREISSGERRESFFANLFNKMRAIF